MMLVYKAGKDDGCVVIASGDAAFDKAAFYTDLGRALGVTVSTDPKKPITKLRNGEILITIVAQTADITTVQLVVANPEGKHAEPSEGN